MLHSSVCSFAYVTRPVTFAELSLEAGNQHRVFEIKKKKINKNPFEGKRGEEFNPSFPRFVSNDYNNETGSEPFGYIPREESAINNYGMFGVRCI